MYRMLSYDLKILVSKSGFEYLLINIIMVGERSLNLISSAYIATNQQVLNVNTYSYSKIL